MARPSGPSAPPAQATIIDVPRDQQRPDGLEPALGDGPSNEVAVEGAGDEAKDAAQDADDDRVLDAAPEPVSDHAGDWHRR